MSKTKNKIPCPSDLNELTGAICGNLTTYLIRNDEWTSLADNTRFEDEGNVHTFRFDFDNQQFNDIIIEVVNDFLKNYDIRTSTEKKFVKDIKSAIENVILNFDFYRYSYVEELDFTIIITIEDRKLMHLINEALDNLVANLSPETATQ